MREPARTLVILAHYQGYSHGELAARTALPLGTVKTHLRRALIDMRRVLEPPAPQSLPPAPSSVLTFSDESGAA